MKIKIENWEKFNPRKDLKAMPWFKIKSDIGYSETLFGVDPDLKWLWIFLLSTCARKVEANNDSSLGIIKSSIDYISFHSGLSPERVKVGLELFENKGLVQNPDRSVRNPNESDRITNESVPKRREEKRREEERREENPRTSLSMIDHVIKAYNQHAPLEKKYNSFFLKPKALEDFEITSGFPEFSKVEGWVELFKKAFSSEFLSSSPWCNLQWLLNANNADKVMAGTYGNQKTGLDKSAIRKAIASGASRIDELTIDLGESEAEWIKQNGGLRQLGQVGNDYELEKLLKGA